ncbi:MAG TPA: carbon-nitrogen hydrolase family protein, partial [Campylobacterales bacterium]|nr:carbon-nitrogen hydrolase family protein [Campylobacterales bacterium]
IAIIGGFELHFDAYWQKIKEKKADLVLLPTVSTFESKARWREIAKTRAFLANTYILRANRIGEFESKEGKWNFYGDSFFVSPYGEVESHLGKSEEILIAEVSKSELTAARKSWGFGKISSNIGIIE